MGKRYECFGYLGSDTAWAISSMTHRFNCCRLFMTKNSSPYNGPQDHRMTAASTTSDPDWLGSCQCSSMCWLGSSDFRHSIVQPLTDSVVMRPTRVAAFEQRVTG